MPKRIVVFATLAVLGAFVPRTSDAQRRVMSSVDLGTPIRVHVIGKPPASIEGTLAGVDSLGVSVMDPVDSSRVLVRWEQTSLIQAQTRMAGSEAFMRGGRVGLAFGGGLGVVVVVAAAVSQDCDCVLPRAAAIPIAAVLAGTGFVVGGIIGSSFKQGWQRVWP